MLFWPHKMIGKCSLNSVLWNSFCKIGISSLNVWKSFQGSHLCLEFFLRFLITNLISLIKIIQLALFSSVLVNLYFKEFIYFNKIVKHSGINCIYYPLIISLFYFTFSLLLFLKCLGIYSDVLFFIHIGNLCGLFFLDQCC